MQLDDDGRLHNPYCPNCDMVLASMAYLEIHINRSATMCHLCGMQCCYGVNLKKHMNIKCDLAKRNRNYGVIAKESAILERGIINSKKLYNLPLKQMWTNKRKMLANKITERKTLREIRVPSLISCGFCSNTFDTPGAVNLHRHDKHPEYEEFRPVEMDPGDQEITFACPICERNFNFHNTCAVHIKVDHLGWKQRKKFNAQIVTNVSVNKAIW